MGPADYNCGKAGRLAERLGQAGCLPGRLDDDYSDGPRPKMEPESRELSTHFFHGHGRTAEAEASFFMNGKFPRVSLY